MIDQRASRYLDYYTRDAGLAAALAQYQKRHGCQPETLYIRAGTTPPPGETVPNGLEIVPHPYVPVWALAFDLPATPPPGLQRTRPIVE